MRVLAFILVAAVVATGGFAAYRLHKLSDELVRITSHALTLTRTMSEARVLAREVRAVAEREIYGAPLESEAPGRSGAAVGPIESSRRINATLRAELSGLREIAQRQITDETSDVQSQRSLVEQIGSTESLLGAYERSMAAALQNLQEGDVDDLGGMLAHLDREGKAISSRIDEISERVWKLTTDALQASVAIPQVTADRIVELCLVAALIVLVTSIFARRYVSQRLRVVVESLESLATRGAADPLLVNSGDEFGRAASAFNRIRGQILRANATYAAEIAGAREIEVAAMPVVPAEPGGVARTPLPALHADEDDSGAWAPVAEVRQTQAAAERVAPGDTGTPVELDALANLVERIVSQASSAAEPEPAAADRVAAVSGTPASTSDSTTVLASRAADATDALGAQLAGIQQVTRASVEAIQGISSTVAQIKELLAAVAPSEPPERAADPGKIRAFHASG
jgi:methyl-accepting chemotaxis protein